MNMIQAINSAIDIAMGRDEMIVVLGEDVGYFGGVFKATEGLQKRYGKTRVFDTPISECGIIGVAVGMATYGLRPVPEIQFADYIYPALDQLVSEAARLRYRSGGEFTAPITVRTPFGGGIFGGQTHSQSPEGIFTHVAGLKTVIPSNPYDAKGLLIAAIEDNDPVIFFEPKRIYNGPFDGHHDRPVQPWSKFAESAVPEGYYKVPLGKANVVREGNDVTVLAYGTMVHVAHSVIKETGVDAELIDLRTLVPLDIETVVASVKKTGRCMVVHEATKTSGFGAELSALVQEHCFHWLEAPVQRVTGWDTPYPHSLEWAYFPGPVRLTEALKRVMQD
ncbi:MULTISPECIES: alpha-ketoacid dehydrogenase subunit beta [unclassified Sphingomonas]|uniref:alpha-ketoacid dehydrogenase subunit beta n=1 Tax=unclassified Sphingomonas TaxID=196159 RepID=UPI0006FD161B|nr:MULTISPECIES: alpha-ketoacid dehydrogenase subunit beta [unclassified Sphingomonas]KQX24873.1 2-oxoisovalerate dehydrogenase [Sphingomonas sp. Root1294]KQY69861.1 2-oxoisovalerate dehydrogenase [Sphingomonas sp. Root50]KRB93975.1 2-oxoisovalerate dehydrogenase [Sphingomonas sp. Root720]